MNSINGSRHNSGKILLKVIKNMLSVERRQASALAAHSCQRNSEKGVLRVFKV